MEIIVTGAEEFGTLARHLKAAPAEVRKELFAAISHSTGPLKVAARASAESVLPHRGGLAQLVAGSRLATRRRSGGANVGIRIQATGMEQLALINRGTVIHSTYGHRPRVVQHVTPGWYTLPMEAGAPGVRIQIVEAIRRVARKIEARI